MGSHKKSPKKKKQPSREYSMDLGTEQTFSNMERSSVRQGTQDSDESWLRYYLDDNTPTPVPKKQHGIRSQSKESDEIPLVSPEKLKIQPSRQPSVANIKSKGTGPHDNKLAKAQGDYRESSLRRGSGMTFNTPDAFKRIPTTDTNNIGHDGAQSTESVAGPSTSSGQKPNVYGPYGTRRVFKRVRGGISRSRRSKAQRGDLNPVGHRPLAIVKTTAHVQNTAPPRSTNKKDNEEQYEAAEKPMPEKPEAPVARPSDHIPDEKESILKICLTLKNSYLSHAPGMEKEFWKTVASKLPIDSQYKDSWNDLRVMVNALCRTRKSRLREGTLTKSTDTGMEMNALIDKWNEVFARRFCCENRGFLKFADKRPAEEGFDVPKPKTSVADFDDKIWPAVKEILIPFAQKKIVELIENKLQETMEELELSIRPPVLKGNSSPETYRVYLNYLKGRVQAAGKKTSTIQESEALISLLADLLPSTEMNLRQQLVGDVEEHDGDSGMFESEGHSESPEDIEDIEDAEDDVSCYQPSILESIEPRTPIVTPRVMAELKKFENRFVEALRADKAQEKLEHETLRSRDDNGQSADAIKGLAIRNKSTELVAPKTPEEPATKKRCLEEHQLGSSPPSSPTSPEFPPMEQLFSSSMGRESSAITQPTPVPARSSFGAKKKRKTPHDFGENGSPATKAPLHAQESPGLFVTPDPSLSGRSDRVFKFKKSVSRNVVLGKKRASENEKYAESSRFREETAEYQALSPNERETMMYRAIKEMRKQ
ncbi:hypothetical protein FAVG1_04215 [Fusarium avenaceum]|nr:hypothetical protein FAVG1_04215 [Fusarium avenaceum]